jgi:signal transduction histidine kinase
VGGDFSQRIESRGTQDEFDQLAGNLNHMLDRIEQLMSDLRHAGDSIAHDLRTPLTRLRHSLESAMQIEDAGELRESVGESIADVDRLLATFSALLRIARLESGGYRLRREPLILAELVSDALELYDVVAEEKRIAIDTELDADAIVAGDRDLVFQLIANLLDNAIKYTPDDGDIRIKVTRTAIKAQLDVIDNGPGVPEEELDRVTRRFYRVDGSRSHPGSGLGLSLVQAVAAHHDAELVLANANPGLKVSVAFPAE